MSAEKAEGSLTYKCPACVISNTPMCEVCKAELRSLLAMITVGRAAMKAMVKYKDPPEVK